MTEPNLRARLDALAIGPADAAPGFIRRLARENAWPVAFGPRVVDEYKRCVYLAARADFEITPSGRTNQAWHLTYTHSYWQDMCRNILGFELQHNPTRSGDGEQRRFAQQYQDTLSFYRQIFGHAPPADIWPAVAERFAWVDGFIRVNRRYRWIVPKPAGVLQPLSLLLLPLLLVACSEQLGETGVWFRIKAVFGIYLVFFILWWLVRHAGKGRGSGCGAGCSGCGG